MRGLRELELAFDWYVDSVLEGERPCGELQRLALERHRRLLADGPARGLRFNILRGLRACWWIERNLRFSKGGEFAGKPVALEPWQIFVVASVFGWEREVDERWIRAIRDVYVSIARKNGKTELAAMLVLVMLYTGGAACDEGGNALPEIGAELYSAATTKDQAALCWKVAYAMVRRSPDLRQRTDIPKRPTAGGRYNLSVHETDSFFRAVSADSDTLDGLGPYCVVVDELHAHPTGGVWDVLGSGMGARTEPLRIGITTAGEDRTGVCGEIEDDAIRVLNQVYEDDSLFAFICRPDEGDDLWDERVWPKANPNLGVTVKLDGMRADAKKAANNAGRRMEFLCKKQNVWITGQGGWMPLQRWDLGGRGLGDEFGPLDLDALRDREVWLGVDIGSVRDTTSLVAVWPMGDGTFAIHPWTFVPEGTIDDPEIRGPRERELLLRWKAAGLITTTPGDMLDHEAIWTRILNCMDRYSIQELIADQTQASLLMGRCEQVGIEVTIHNQGYNHMTPAINLAEVIIGSAKTPSRLRHGGHPVLRYMISNASLRRGAAGGLMIEKKDDKRRVDGVIAFLMALNYAHGSVEQGSQIFLPGPGKDGRYTGAA